MNLPLMISQTEAKRTEREWRGGGVQYRWMVDVVDSQSNYVTVLMDAIMRATFCDDESTFSKYFEF